MAPERTRQRGELEALVLRALWDSAQPLSIREVQQSFGADAPAYTTIATVLERLRAKGEVDRLGQSPRRQKYQASRAESERTSAVMLAALRGAGDREGALLKFAGDMTGDDLDLLRQALGRRR